MAAKTPKHTLCFSRNAETVAWNLDLKKNKHIKRKIRLILSQYHKDLSTQFYC